MNHYQIRKNVSLGFYPSVLDRMEADLNANFSLILRNGQDSSGQNDWRSPAYTTREEYVMSMEDQDMIC